MAYTPPGIVKMMSHTPRFLGTSAFDLKSKTYIQGLCTMGLICVISSLLYLICWYLVVCLIPKPRKRIYTWRIVGAIVLFGIMASTYWTFANSSKIAVGDADDYKNTKDLRRNFYSTENDLYSYISTLTASNDLFKLGETCPPMKIATQRDCTGNNSNNSIYYEAEAALNSTIQDLKDRHKSINEISSNVEKQFVRSASLGINITAVVVSGLVCLLSAFAVIVLCFCTRWAGTMSIIMVITVVLVWMCLGALFALISVGSDFCVHPEDGMKTLLSDSGLNETQLDCIILSASSGPDFLNDGLNVTLSSNSRFNMSLCDIQRFVCDAGGCNDYTNCSASSPLWTSLQSISGNITRSLQQQYNSSCNEVKALFNKVILEGQCSRDVRLGSEMIFPVILLLVCLKVLVLALHRGAPSKYIENSGSSGLLDGEMQTIVGSDDDSRDSGSYVAPDVETKS